MKQEPPNPSPTPLFGNLFRDRDGDLGIGIEAGQAPNGDPWIKLKYKNGRTSWMPAHFLKEIEKP
jgi:hypothetical protein